MTSRDWSDVVVPGDVRIAVRDHPGPGHPVVLLHGAFRTLDDWSLVAPLLVRRHRVVSVDLRGHGRSGDGPWTWQEQVADLARVVDHLGVDRPAVVGHSLGGMVAGWWAAQHPECPAAVNLDGTGANRAVELLDGIDAVTAVEWDARVREMNREIVSLMDGSDVGERPSAETAKSLLDALESAHMLDVYAATRAPLMFVSATRLGDESSVAGVEWYGEFESAYRRGLTRRLDALADVNPLFHHTQVDADHALVLREPRLVAELVGGFLDAHVSGHVA